MPVPAQRPPQLVGRVFRSRDVLGARLLTRAQLRSAAWRRLFHGVYADAALPVDHGLRCAGAALRAPAEAAIAGRSAAYLHGVRLAECDDPVEIVVPLAQRFGPVAGLHVRTAALPATDVGPGRPRATTPLRTALDVAMGSDVVEAVVLLDAMAQAGVLRGVNMEVLHARLIGARGGARGLEALALHDPGAESPQESRLRVGLVLAGLPRPRCQHVVRLPGGGFAGRVDLAWPERRLAVEYDGRWHAETRQFRRDRARLNRLVAAGWTVLHVTDDRLRHDLAGIVRQIAALLAA